MVRCGTAPATLLAAAALAQPAAAAPRPASTTDSAALAPSGAGRLRLDRHRPRSGDQWTAARGAPFASCPAARPCSTPSSRTRSRMSAARLGRLRARCRARRWATSSSSCSPRMQEHPVVLTQPADEDKLRALLDAERRRRGHARDRRLDGDRRDRGSARRLRGRTGKGASRGRPGLQARRLAACRATRSCAPTSAARALRGLVARAGAAAGALGGLGARHAGSSAVSHWLSRPRTTASGSFGSVEQEGLPASFSPKLLPRCPHGAFVAGTFTGEGLSEQLRGAIAGKDEQLRQFEKLTGLELRSARALHGRGRLLRPPGAADPGDHARDRGGRRSPGDDRQPVPTRSRRQAKTTVTKAVEDGVTVHALTDSGVTIRYARDGRARRRHDRCARNPGPRRQRGPKLVDDDDFAAADARGRLRRLDDRARLRRRRRDRAAAPGLPRPCRRHARCADGPRAAVPTRSSRSTASRSTWSPRATGPASRASSRSAEAASVPSRACRHARSASARSPSPRGTPTRSPTRSPTRCSTRSSPTTRRPRRLRDADHDRPRRRRGRDHDRHLRRHPRLVRETIVADRLHAREVRLRRRDLRRHRRDRRAVARHRAGRRRVVRGPARRRRPARPARRRRPGDDVRLRVDGDRRADAAADHARAQADEAALRGPQGRRAPLPAAGRQGAGDGALRGRRARPPAARRDRAHPRLDAAPRRDRRRDAAQARPARARRRADPPRRLPRPVRADAARARRTSSTSTRPASS